MKTRLLLIVIALWAFAPGSSWAIGITAPGYRYCGPGNNGGRPTNALDRLCQSHDYCYRRTRRNRSARCACDRSFVSSAQAMSRGSQGSSRMRRSAGKFARIIRAAKRRCFR